MLHPLALKKETYLLVKSQASAIILPTYAGYENVWCGGGAQVHPNDVGLGVDSNLLPIISFSLSESVLDFSSPLCTFQGAMLQFGFLAAVFWWALIAFNMCFEVTSLALNLLPCLMVD